MASKYQQLADNLKHLINVQIKEGINKLPTEKQLCDKYHVSRQTVRVALSILEKDGLIEKRHGSGSFITGLASDFSQNTVAILISDEDAYTYPMLINDITTTLSQQNFHFRIYQTENSINREREILLELLQTPIRGIIVEGIKTALPNPNLDLYEQLLFKGIRLIFVGNHYPALKDSFYIEADNITGGLYLTENLIQNNYSSIGALFNIEDLSSHERYKGFLDACIEHKLPIKDNQSFWFHTEDLMALRKNNDTSFLKEIIKKAIPYCDSFICHNNEIAYWLSKELSMLDSDLLESIAIASFDHTYLSNYKSAYSTTIALPAHALGVKAAQAMINSFKGLEQSPALISWNPG